MKYRNALKLFVRNDWRTYIRIWSWTADNYLTIDVDISKLAKTVNNSQVLFICVTSTLYGSLIKVRIIQLKKYGRKTKIKEGLFPKKV